MHGDHEPSIGAITFFYLSSTPWAPSLSYTIPSAALGSPRTRSKVLSREHSQMNADPIVGKSVPRKEGRDKVTGRSQYVDDVVLPNMFFGATVRSQIPRGRIRKITFGPGIPWD